MMPRPLLESTRLNLRLISLSDLENIHELHSLPETDKYNTLGIPENIEETYSIVEGWVRDNEAEVPRNFTFAIESNTAKSFIGLMAIKLGNMKYRRGEVWFKLHPTHWNQGYATEALKTLVKFAFDELNLHRIEAGCAIENIGSVRVLEKVGMIREGQSRKVLPLKSGWSDNYEYALLESDGA